MPRFFRVAPYRFLIFLFDASFCVVMVLLIASHIDDNLLSWMPAALAFLHAAANAVRVCMPPQSWLIDTTAFPEQKRFLEG